jgi:hypothetical protein
MHLDRILVNPLGGEAVSNGCDFDILIENDSEDNEVILAFLAAHNLLDRGKPDIVLEVDAVALKPLVELLGGGLKLIGLYNFDDQFLVHPHFDNIFKKDAEEVGQHISTLFLH